MWIKAAGEPGGACYATVPVDDRRAVTFIVGVHDDSTGNGPKGDLCAVALRLATASLPHLSETHLRANSQRAHMNPRLATLDPCAVLGTVGQGRQPVLQERFGSDLIGDPWECDFRLGDASASHHISYWTGSDSMATAFRDNQRDTTIGGLRAVEDAAPGGPFPAGSCQIIVSTGPQPAASGLGADHGRMNSGTAETIWVEADNGCDAARATAAELVRLYNQLPR